MTMLAWLKSRLQMPTTAGPTEVLRAIDASVTPITRDGDAWRVESTEDRVVRLFELPLAGIDNSMLGFRATVRTQDAKGVYLQMWCRLGGQEFFSKGLHDKVRGTTDWSTHEIPFLLRRNQ